MKQPKKARLWLNDGSWVRLCLEYRNHVWPYDFVHHRTEGGRAFRTLNILDEHSRECLTSQVKRKLNSAEVVAEAVRGWINPVGAKTACIEPGPIKRDRKIAVADSAFLDRKHAAPFIIVHKVIERLKL